MIYIWWTLWKCMTECHVMLKYDIYGISPMPWPGCTVSHVPSLLWRSHRTGPGCCLCTAARCSYDKSSFYAQSAAQHSHFCNVIFIHKLAKSGSVPWCDLIRTCPSVKEVSVGYKLTKVWPLVPQDVLSAVKMHRRKNASQIPAQLKSPLEPCDR